MMKSEELRNALGAFGALKGLVGHESAYAQAVDQMKVLARDGALLLDGKDWRAGSMADDEIIERCASTRWFSRIAPCLYRLSITPELTGAVQRRVCVLQRRCLRWSNPTSLKDAAAREDVLWVLGEARELVALLGRTERERPYVRSVSEVHSCLRESAEAAS